jgi:hypothetical protein
MAHIRKWPLSEYFKPMQNIADLCKLPKRILRLVNLRYCLPETSLTVCHYFSNQPNQRKVPVCSTRYLLRGVCSPSVENKIEWLSSDDGTSKMFKRRISISESIFFFFFCLSHFGNHLNIHISFWFTKFRVNRPRS